jgi:hypothetical protein
MPRPHELLGGEEIGARVAEPECREADDGDRRETDGESEEEDDKAGTASEAWNGRPRSLLNRDRIPLSRESS